MIKTWSLTDVGLVRKENEDSFAISERTDYSICVVCDGMGGAAGGKLASSIAAETFIREMEKLLQPDMTPQQLRETSALAISCANMAIQERAAQINTFRSMGTTLVSAVVYADGAVLANVGDSRAYHISESGIVQLTKDHSLVESMVEHGEITAAEARHHPSRNYITRALGTDTVAECDSYFCPLQTGEYLLLCTDGLVNTVTDQEMLFEILYGGETDTCLKRMMKISKRQGAADNVTAVLMKIL